MQILTCKRRAPLNWLYRLGGLHVRILEHVQLEIGDRETARMLEDDDEDSSRSNIGSQAAAANAKLHFNQACFV